MRALIFTFSLLIYSVISEEFESGYSNFDSKLDAHSFFGFVESPLENEEMARIINGEETEDTKRPYMVWIKTIDKDDVTVRRCGGVILTPYIILTAAQCLWVHGKRPGREPAKVEVIVGDIDYNGEGAVSIFAKNWKIHPDFNWNILNNDIALVNLTRAITFGKNAWNISLPTKKQVGSKMDTFAGGIAVPHGWGGRYKDSDPNCPPPARKKRVPFEYVEMKVMNHTPCRIKLREVFYDLPEMSNCLDTVKGDIGICGADIGGPVTSQLPTSVFPTIIGIISHYEDCPTWYPNTFTYLTTKLLDWIGKTAGIKIK